MDLFFPVALLWVIPAALVALAVLVWFRRQGTKSLSEPKDLAAPGEHAGQSSEVCGLAAQNGEPGSASTPQAAEGGHGASPTPVGAAERGRRPSFAAGCWSCGLPVVIVATLGTVALLVGSGLLYGTEALGWLLAYLFFFAITYAWVPALVAVALWIWLAAGLHHRSTQEPRTRRPGPRPGGLLPALVLAAAGLVTAWWILGFSVPAIEGRVLDSVTGEPVAGALVRRKIAALNRLSALSRRERQTPYREQVSSDVMTSADGTFRFPAWISIDPPGFRRLGGVGFVVRAAGHVHARVCLPLGEADAGGRNPCGFSYSGSNKVPGQVRGWSRTKVEISLRRVDSLKAAEDHFAALASSIWEGDVLYTEFATAVEDYARRYSVSRSILGSIGEADDKARQRRDRRWSQETRDVLRTLVVNHCRATLDPELLRHGCSLEMDAWPALRQQRVTPYHPRWRELVSAALARGETAYAMLGELFWIAEAAARPGLVPESMAELTTRAGVLADRAERDRLDKDAWVGSSPVAVLYRHNPGDVTGAWLSAAGIPFGWERTGFDPARMVEKTPVVVCPSGTLPTGAEPASNWWERMKSQASDFVLRGGTLIVLSQPSLSCWGVLPVPDGEVLEAAGRDGRVSAEHLIPSPSHPTTEFAAGRPVRISATGHFVRWPAQAAILLRTPDRGSPVALSYPVGRGLVVAATVDEDMLTWTKQASSDGTTWIASVVRWVLPAPAGSVEHRARSRDGIEWNVEVGNFTDSHASVIEWTLTPAGSSKPVWRRLEARDVPSGGQAHCTVRVDRSDAASLRPGVYELQFSLADERRSVSYRDGREPWLVQPASRVATLFVRGDPL